MLDMFECLLRALVFQQETRCCDLHLEIRIATPDDNLALMFGILGKQQGYNPLFT